MTTDLKFGARTDVGRERDHNEDNFLVDKKLGLFVVCDGMGGHAAGEIASALAIRTFHEQLKTHAEKIAAYTTRTEAGSRVERRDIVSLLEEAADLACTLVHAEAQKDPSKRGMGTTLAALLVAATEAFVIWVGDSRIYLLRDGVLEQLTEDHNVLNELLRRKKLPREEIEKLPQRNAITRAIGVYEHTQPEHLIVDLLAGDRFLLCSDGLSGYFEDEGELTELVGMLGGPDETQVVAALIDAANAKGGRDNITTILLTMGDPAVRDEQRARKLQLKRDILARMPMFRALGDREILRLLQVVDVVAFHDEEVVIREGDKGEELFIVLTGSVKVVRGDMELARLKPGDHFGEMALVRNQPRSATVISDLDSELMVIRRSDFFEILRTESQMAVKLLWQFLSVLGDRLADTSRELGKAREELAAEDITAEIFSEREETRRSPARPPPPSLRNPGSR